MTVSVVVPVYNNITYLGATLQSIVGQSTPPEEVIVVDDGSVAMSLPEFGSVAEFVEDFGDSRVRCIVQTNGGANVARNAGAASARCDWLAFCDSDDVWQHEKLSSQLRLLNQSRDCFCCITDYATFSGQGPTDRSHFSYAPPSYWERGRCDHGGLGFVIERNLFLDYLDFQPAITSTVIVRRDYFERIGRWSIALSRSSADDMEFHFRCANNPPLAVVPQVMMHYRRRPDSGSADEIKQLHAGVEILRYILANEGRAMESAARFNDAIESLLSEACWSAFHFRRLDLFRRYYRELPRSRRTMGLRARFLFSLVRG